MTVRMDERFAWSLRGALVEHVQAAPARRRRTRWRAAVGGVLGAVIVGGGVAAAAGVLPFQGADVVTPLAPAVTVTGSGTQTVELGAPPVGATVISISLTCLTEGRFFTADGANMECSAADAGSQTMGWKLPVQPGQQSTVIRAGTGERWRLIAAYSSVTTSMWGVNADDQTYGVANAKGTPDLLAVIATNGRSGYVYSRDLQAPAPTALQTGAPTGKPIVLPVYTSDGHTMIGEFITNEAAGSPSASPIR